MDRFPGFELCVALNSKCRKHGFLFDFESSHHDNLVEFYFNNLYGSIIRCDTTVITEFDK